jgi:hypothetical protein
MAALAAGAKKALIAFVVMDALIVAGALALWLGVFRPQQQAIERARDHALRATTALAARLHAVEARAALKLGDSAGAHTSVRLASERLAALAVAVPKDATGEAKDVADAAARLGLVDAEIDRDAVSAARDLELVDARLAALYPTTPPPSP